LLNVYSNANQSTLKYLKNTEANIWNVLIITSNFNIRDSNWDPLYPFHLVYSNLLVDITDAFDLFFSYSINSFFFTKYLDNENNLNSVIDFIFLRPNFLEFNSYTIFLELWYSLDHALLVVDIHITKEFIQDKRCTIVKNSKEKEEFTSDLIEAIKKINISYLVNKESLELAV